jgi:pyridoxal phosphate enzyme (YggS family)
VTASTGVVDAARIAAGIAAVRQRIDDAARAAGRDPAAVRLVAVAKWQPVEAVQAAATAGILDIGENYVQEMLGKSRLVDAVRWHFIGRLQRNKVGAVVSAGAVVHSLDSLDLAQALGRRAAQAGAVLHALVQVEVDDRSAAHGVRPEQLPGFLAACAQIDGLSIDGLMVMPAHTDPAVARVAFAKVAELRGRLDAPAPLTELSMGMSHDFEAAVAEGATLVRVGTAVFGPREPRTPQ